MLDEDHDTPDYDSSYDDNVYTFGSVAGHNVVIATCPPGLTGNVNAGRVTGAMFKTFSSLRMAILVGIGGGVPEITHSQDPMENLHLGDVVVGWPADGGDACVAYDAGRWHTDGHFEVLGTINRPDRVLLNALGKLMLDHQMGKTTFHEHRDRLVNSKHRRKFAFPGLEKDQLYQANYKHSGVYGDGCKDCEHSKVVSRPLRTEEDVQEFVFHQGRIATGNAVVQDGEYRDEISRRCGKSVLCIEMEAAGVDASRAALVIRGISDYSDSHKGDAWRSYAAGNAAIFARELLSKITPATVQKMEIQDSKAEQEKVLRWFIDCSSEDQHRDIRKKQPLEDTTAEWFYQSDEAASVTFRSWRDQAPVSTHDRLLWAYGHPAAGKTVVVSQVIEHLRKHFCSPSQPHPRRTGIAYSYISMLNKYSTVEKSFTPELLILSLTRALLEQLPNVPASSKQFFEANRLRMSRLLDSSQVVGHLKDLCKLMFDDVYVIVDGLDEMGEKEMHRTIEYLKDLPPNIKIMFVSRYMDAIRDAIGTSFSLHIRAHEHDVKLYFAKEVEENSTFAALLKEAERAKPGQRSITEKALVRQAMFSFAAAKLCMEMLLRVRTPYELQQTVDDLPPPHEMYQNIFRRIKSRWDGSDRDWTKKILTWVCFARWTLSPWQLLYIIGLDFQHPNLNHTNLLAPESLLTSLCDGLVLVDEATQKVSIFHLDVLQFFQSNEQTYFPDAHHDIAEMCVAHIKAASALGLGIKQHPLRGFTIDAIRYLGYHVRTYMAHAEPDLGHPVRRLTSQSLTSSEDSGFSRDLQRNTMSTKSADLCDKLASLLNDERCLLLLNVIMVQHRLHSEEEMFAGDGATKLHVAAAMGFLDTTQRLAVDSQLLSVEDNFGRTALNVAIEWKHSDVAESLVKLGSQVEIEKPSGQTIFAMIVSQGNIKLALDLLKAAETPHKHRNPFRSRSHTNDPVSLLSATLNNDEGEVQRLISDAELRRSHAAETSLLVAADRGHQKILEILLNGDVSVDTSDIQDRTALHRAACRNDVNMVNTLIRHGADVNAIDKAGYTPWTSILFLPDHDEVEKILVSCSANVNASDYAGVSVLYTAASGGHVAVVNKLIEAGVDPTPRTVFGWTPLVSNSYHQLSGALEAD
ncbi:hypothetical protein J4E82_001091 [Alternaria postmessia]|uniref:uncharacterized protein n=1 Tax=Alternaria postmessia TaxID=1187938 RepID=UPI0022247231|nr:uncharacterized protein J4E82_001091 [Alternaria postmessia]KAI5380018.1 hypothetical protein J4E82_001091 [Alternaria postmessia]